jgi:RNA 2',3'-cyclic 3'-phosphodiesterase
MEPGETPSSEARRVRAFFALALPEPAKAALLEAQERMQRRARRTPLEPRWQPDEKLHLTLKFLAWIAPESVAPLWSGAAALARACPPIDARIVGFGAFGLERRARVVVAAISDKSALLAPLSRDLETLATEHGVPAEERAFRPHVTIARIKRPGDVRSWIEVAKLDPFDVRFDELRLYRSDPTPSGGRYTVLDRAPLGGPIRA